MKLNLAKKGISALLALAMTIGFAPASVFAMEAEIEEPVAQEVVQEEAEEVKEAPVLEEEIEIIPEDGETLQELEAKIVEAADEEPEVEAAEEQKEEVADEEQAFEELRAAEAAASWADAADTSWYDASESEFDIENAAQLAGLAKLVNDGTDDFAEKVINLTENVNLSGKNWVAIGNNKNGEPFKGVFDGNGYAIKGLKIEAEGNHNEYFGLFGYVDYINGSYRSATVKNVIVDGNINVKNTTNGYAEIGGIIAKAGDMDVINCISKVNVDAENVTGTIGGIVGSFIGKRKMLQLCNSAYTGMIKTYGEELGTVGEDGCADAAIAGGIIGKIENVEGSVTYIESCTMDAVIFFGTIDNQHNDYACGALVGRVGKDGYTECHITRTLYPNGVSRYGTLEDKAQTEWNDVDEDDVTTFDNAADLQAKYDEFMNKAYAGKPYREAMKQKFYGIDIVPIHVNGSVLETAPFAVDTADIDFGKVVYGNAAADKEIAVTKFTGETIEAVATNGFTVTDNNDGTYTIKAPTEPVEGGNNGEVIFSVGEYEKRINVKVVIEPKNLEIASVEATGVVGADVSTINVTTAKPVDGSWKVERTDGNTKIETDATYVATFTPAETLKYNVKANIQATVKVNTYGINIDPKSFYTGAENYIVAGTAPISVVYTVENVGDALNDVAVYFKEGNNSNADFKLNAGDKGTLNAANGQIEVGALEKGGKFTFELVLSNYATAGMRTAEVMVSAAEMTGANAHVEMITVNVIAKSADPKNTTISSIVAGGNDVGGMDAGSEDKEITVDNNVTEIEITVTTENPDATVTVNGKPVDADGKAKVGDLVVGRNEVKVKVVGADGKTENEYTITIIRKAKSSGGSSSGGSGGGSSTNYKGLLLTDSATGVSVAGEQIANNAKIKVTEMKLHDEAACEACKEIAKHIEDKSFIMGYDISLTPAATAMKGKATVTIPVKGMENGDVLVLHCKDKKLETIKAIIDNGKVTFTVDSFSPFAIVKTDSEAEQYKNPFEDVKDSDWFKDDVAYVYLFNLMKGTTDTKFDPTKATSRAMLVTILWRLEGEPGYTATADFEDVAAGQWYTDGILWAASNKIVTGYSDKAFGPNDSLTREQLAVILYRYAQYKGYDVTGSADISGFADNAKVSDWAVAAVKWAVAQKLITGTASGLVLPAGEAQRAQTAAILHRFVENIAKDAK